MLKRICVAFCFVLAVVFSLQADSTTSRLGLTKPDQSSTGWGTKLNTNFDTIDANVAVLGGSNIFSGQNTFTSTSSGFPYGFSVGYIQTIVGCQTGGANCNTAIGSGALGLLRPSGYLGRPNIAIGASSLGNFVDDGNNSSTSGGQVAVGYGSLSSSTNSLNIAIGDFAGAYLVTGTGNVYLGNLSGAGAGGSSTSFNGTRQIYIGQYTGPDRGASTFLYNAVAIGAGAVVNSSSSLVLGCMDGTVNSIHATCLSDDTSFKVGIGTDTPRERLHIVGNFRIDSGTIIAPTVSSMSATGYLQLDSKTLLQLKAITPSAVGQKYYCSNCTTDAEVISTGTTTGAFARVSARTTTIQ